MEKIDLNPPIINNSKEISVLRAVYQSRKDGLLGRLEYYQSGASRYYHEQERGNLSSDIDRTKSKIEEIDEELKFLSKEKYPVDIVLGEYEAKKFVNDLNDLVRTNAGRYLFNSDVKINNREYYDAYISVFNKIDTYVDEKYGIYAKGGSIEQENNDMLRNQIREVAHHSKEIKEVVNKRTRVEPWVVAKMERASSDLSDVTHYLDGERYEDGGSVGEAKELKGYRVQIFKSYYGTSSNIVSDHLDSAILVTDGKSGDSSTVMSNEPYLKLIRRDIFGKTVLSAEPVNFGNEQKRKMFGGTFVWSSDSRFRENISEQPIQLHDRVEYSHGGSMYADGGIIDVVDKYNRMNLPNKIFSNNKIYTGYATFINGYSSYDSSENDGYLIGEGVYLTDENGSIIRSKERRGLTIYIEDGKFISAYKNGGNISSENAEKIAKLEKYVLTSTFVPDAVKERVRLEIEKLKSESSESKGLSSEQRDLNKKALALVDKNKITNFEALVTESLTDANYHSESFKFATLVDSSIKTKEDWYKAERFSGDEKTSDTGIAIASMCGWDGNKITECLTFVLKMKGEHKLSDALNKAMEVEEVENQYPNRIENITKNQEFFIKEIATRTATNQNAVTEFVKNNGLTESQTLNIVQGLGMGKLKPMDFVTALVGNPGNEYEQQIIAFAKSNEAFKTPEQKATEPAKTEEPKEQPKEQPKVSDDRLKGKHVSDVSTYISHRNIETVTFTIDGKKYTVKGSDIFDGIYVENKAVGVKAKRTTKAKQPKVSRTQFEEEEFEFGKRGKA